MVSGEADRRGGEAPVRQAGGAKVDLSVTIVAYKSAEIVSDAVRSLFEHAGGLSLEVIVVDNASGDGSAEAIKAACPEAVVLASRHNGGYAWGNNVGIARARGRHLLVLNPDTLVGPDTLAAAVAYLDSHPEVGILGAHASYGDGTPQSTRFRFPTLASVAWRTVIPERIVAHSARFGDQRYAGSPADGIADVDAVLGSFMMVPRRALERVGPMDDGFFLYSEETEWCWRMRAAGLKVRYHPGVRITHFGSGTTGGASPFVLVELSRGQIMFFRKAYGPLRARVAAALMLVSALGRTVWMPDYKDTPGTELRAAWRARARFLAGAVVRLPAGQVAPPAARAEADGVAVEVTLADAGGTAEAEE